MESTGCVRRTCGGHACDCASVAGRTRRLAGIGSSEVGERWRKLKGTLVTGLGWSDVLDVALREPDLPQIMNVNAAAVLANAATRAQYGMDVVVTIYENGRADDLIFGGLLGRAMEMANLIRQRIHTVPVAAV